MKRALQLARNGEGHVSPNPMVGAVIVSKEGRIIGEGYHAQFGGPHAEVNAVASVREEDRHLLPDSTIYVTLEPCAHYGKTPPCANLIVSSGIKKVVIASPDPNPLVAGKGVKILRDAGIEVTEGVLREEADELNKRFMTSHKKHRPYILLKWAQSADRFMAAIDEEGKPTPVKFSNKLSQVWMHRERAHSDAIMVGRNTLKTDKPRLDSRLWGGKDPKRIDCCHDMDLESLIKDLHTQGITSLMVEGGGKLLESFIRKGLYDEIRIETSPILLKEGINAPAIPENVYLLSSGKIRDNKIETFRVSE